MSAVSEMTTAMAQVAPRADSIRAMNRSVMPTASPVQIVPKMHVEIRPISKRTRWPWSMIQASGIEASATGAPVARP